MIRIATCVAIAMTIGTANAQTIDPRPTTDAPPPNVVRTIRIGPDGQELPDAADGSAPRNPAVDPTVGTLRRTVRQNRRLLRRATPPRRDRRVLPSRNA